MGISLTPSQLTWVSFLALEPVFPVLSVGSWDAGDPGDPTVLGQDRPGEEEEQRRGGEAQPVGGLGGARARTRERPRRLAPTPTSPIQTLGTKKRLKRRLKVRLTSG